MSLVVVGIGGSSAVALAGALPLESCSFAFVTMSTAVAAMTHGIAWIREASSGPAASTKVRSFVLWLAFLAACPMAAGAPARDVLAIWAATVPMAFGAALSLAPADALNELCALMDRIAERRSRLR